MLEILQHRVKEKPRAPYHGIAKAIQTGGFSPYTAAQRQVLFGYLKGWGIAVISATALFLAPMMATGQVTFVAKTGAANPLGSVGLGNTSTPVFVDIDNDGDKDVFIGKGDGYLAYYQNTGSNSSPTFAGGTNPFNNATLTVDVGDNSAPTFVDMDNDGDFDAVVGKADGYLVYYQNTGSNSSPTFVAAANPFNNGTLTVDVGENSTPTFVDIDNDGDFDAFVGEKDGYINYYKNTGSAGTVTPTFVEQTGAANPFNGVDVGDYSAPAFADIDKDGDFDAVIGKSDGYLVYYQNTGSNSSPTFASASNPFNNGTLTVDVGDRATPTFVDIDNDSDFDAFVGETDGYINYYQNTTPCVHSVTIVSNDADNNINAGTSVTFTATPTNGGSAPTYQWKKNGTNVGTNAATYTDATLANNDVISVVMTSNAACASLTTATSNAITMTVIANPCAAFGTRLYVTQNGTGNGSSWTNATSDLQAAINNTCGITEIWVAAGTYKPTTTTDRNISFVMKNGVAIYGGFAGLENTLSQRNWTNNPTILSGNIGNVNVDTDNSYRVISNNGLNNTAVLDGFTVTGGNANDEGTLDSGVGGGIYNNNASPTFNNVTVSGNRAYEGGGIYNAGGLPTFTNVTVSGNTAHEGGGIFNDGSSPTFTNVTVSGNTAYEEGGGIFNAGSSPTFTNVTTSGNTADFYGGGIYNNGGSPTFTNVTVLGNTANEGGGIYNNNASPTFTNVTVLGNTATYGGGGFYNAGGSPTFTNITVSGNTAANQGGGVYNYYASPNIRNSIIWNNGSSAVHNNNNSTPTFSYSIIQGSGGSSAWNSSYGTDNGNNLDADPLFVGSTDFTLQAASPAINVGNSALNTTATDLAGNARINGAAIDMGAYENTCTFVTPSVVIASDATNNSITAGTSVTFTATPTNGGSAPTYQWKKNGANVGTNAATYTDATLANNDVISVEMTSSEACALPTMVVSSAITMTVTANPCAAFGTRLYVTENGTGDGSSWTNATSNLQAAINNTCGITEIWVAAGTYKPTTTTDRNISFVMKNGVAIYGGFAGSENTLSQRNWANNPTILSGNIGNVNVDTDNSYRVISNNNNGLNNTAVLDGFTVTGGKADGANLQYSGGGIYNNNASPTFTNLIVSGNTASSGGGILISGGLPTFTNVIVSGNTASFGGGIYISGDGASQNTTFVNCLFVNNSAIRGGAIAYDDAPAPYTVELINCTFYSNTDASGGGAFHTPYWDSGQIPPRFENCILWGNSSSVNATGVSGTPVYFAFENTLLQDASCPNNATCTNSLFNQDPLFVSTTNFALQAGSPAINAGNSALNTTTTDLAGNARINGAAIDMGAYENTCTFVTPSVAIASDATNNSITAGTSVTFTATPTNGGSAPTYQWKKNGTNVGTNAATYTDAALVDGDEITVEMTSSEACASPTTATSNAITMTVIANPCAAFGTRLYVTENGTGDGSSWTNATSDLQAAINNTCGIAEVWVAAGTYKPTTTTDRTISFAMKNGVAIYGGFAGSENTLSQRNWANNPTILSGNIGDVNVDTDNSYHVISNNGLNNTAVLDGFTVTGGNANGNGTLGLGGGIYNSNASPTFTNVTVSGNRAGNGGGIYIAGNAANQNIAFVNCLFVNNYAFGGGAIAYDDMPAPYTVELINCTFYGNTGVFGGGVFSIINWNSGLIPPHFKNCILWGNSSSLSLQGAFAFENTLLQNSSCPNNATCTNSLFNQDPLFVSTTDFTLQAASPAINAGNSALNTTTTDLAGNPRVNGAAIDMGAYENTCTFVTPSVVIASDATNNSITAGTSVTFTATPTNGGSAPTYQWKKNGANVGTNSTTYTDATLADGDVITVEMTSSDACASPTTATSNAITMTVIANPCAAFGTRLYVAENGTGDGSSWTNATSDLQAAINNTCGITEIWVAAGTYTPTQHPDPTTAADPRTKSFYLNQDLQIYGGFVGTETQLSQRDPATNITTLSGDIGIVGDNTDNCNHVIITANLTAAAVIDGFTVKGGNASNNSNYITYNGLFFNHSQGGGFYNQSSSPTLANLTVLENTASSNGGGFCNQNSSPTLTNTTVSGNIANFNGGGFYNYQSSPILINVTVSGNAADNAGGGFFNEYTSPNLTNVTVSGNTAAYGGGFYNYYFASPSLTNVTVSGNTATYVGGGFYNESSSLSLTNVIVSGNTADDGGGFYNYQSSPILVNVTVSNNTADNGGGGGFFNDDSSSPILTNVTLSGNTASSYGGALYNYYSSSPIIHNSIVWNNGSSAVYNNNNSTPTFSYSIIQGSGGSSAWNSSYGTDSGNNLNADPLFVSTTDFTLQAASPAINAGNSALNTTTTDLAGNPRVNGAAIDMGAYENTCTFVTSSVAIASDDADNSITAGTSVTFTATPTNGGSAPTYQWKKNGANVGTNSTTYTDAALADGDVITVEMTSSEACASPTTATSSAITMTVIANPCAAFGTRLYVAENGTGDGSSWTNATGDLQAAINNTCGITEIWVAAGTYKPTTTTDRNISFVMKNGVAIYGGFAGTETTLSQRNWANNPTILSGNIGNVNVDTDNSYHVISNDGLNNTAVLDGFTVTGGNANGNGTLDLGGGIYNNNASPTFTNVTVSGNSADDGGGIYNNNASPTFTNLTVSGNSAEVGGGVQNYNGSPTFINVTVSGNTAEDYGGGIYNDIGSPTFINVTVSGNTAYEGGGVYNYGGSPIFTNLTVSGNTADSGGGIYIYGDDATQNMTFVNCLFVNNSANNGGGGAIAYDDIDAPYTVELINCTFYDNTDAFGGGVFYTVFWDSGQIPPRFENCILWGNSSSVNTTDESNIPVYFAFENTLLQNSSCPNNATCTNSLFNQDPLFVSTTNFALQAGSPAINGGNSALNTTTTDLAGNTRINGAAIDMGAYENTCTFVTPSVVIASDATNNSITAGTSVTFTATPTNGGSAPTYQWKKNGNNVGTNAATYTDAALANNDVISVEMTSSEACASPTAATSNAITMTVIANPCAAFGTRLYVAENGTGDGSSWTNATSDLQAAINNTCGITEIWVAAGTYTPTQYPDPTTAADPRTKSFYLNQDLQIYGGFVGTETQLSQRDPATNITTLSGDIGTIDDNTDNAHHVIITMNLTAAAVIDGFTVKGGNAPNNSGYVEVGGLLFINSFGGGFYNQNSSPTLANLTVSENTAGMLGGGFYNRNSSPTLTNVTVSWNTANSNGGGFFNSSSSPTLTNVTVSKNMAGLYGGGIYNNQNSSPTLTNATFFENLAGQNGGGFYNQNSSPTLTNAKVLGNTAGISGGGFYNDSSSPILTNVTVSGNTANTSGGGFYNFFLSSPNIRNSIVWNNGINGVFNGYSTPTFSYSIVQGSGGSSAWSGSSTDGGNNLDADPLFVSTTDFALQAGSPAINAGSDALWTATGLTTDLAGNTRPFGVVDMGAYENQTVVPVEMLYFTGEATENGNLLTWATATEENNAGFEVEKSTDARTFEKIGFVIGNGTTYEQQTYEFLDNNTTNGVTYYRLKQMDFDGQFDYSNIVSIRNENANATAEMLLYPNPVKDFLTIENGEGTAIIYNALGQPLQQFNITDTKYLLNTDDLPKGVYTLQVRKADGTAVVKQFVK